VIERRADDFAHRNPLLQAVLGALSFTAQVERIADAYEGEEEVVPDDPSLLALLGVLAFGARLRALEASVPALSVTAPAVAASDLSLRGMLR
jgi:hypothetical protein